MSAAAPLREAAQNALITLDGIADTNPRETADFETPDEWITWAKSRARWAADALRSPISQEIYAKRILKQMLSAPESDVSQEQTTIISENMRRTIEQALTGAEADADNVPIWWTPDLECLLNELVGKPFKRCATCGYVGHEDPVKGCPSCGFDDMRTKAEEHRDGRLAALEEVAALKFALTALLNDPAVIEAAQPGDIGRALCTVRGI